MSITLKPIQALCLAAALLILGSPAARAQNDQAMQFASRIADTCLGSWETPECLSIVSQSNMVLLSSYGGALQEARRNAEAEDVKQHCAATTAASQQSVPAYAMRSALVECANTLASVAEKTGMQPDPTYSQMMIAPLLCLDADPRCAMIEEQMKAYKTR